MTKTASPIDWKLSLELSNNKPELAQELLDMLQAELPKTQKAIDHAFMKKDWARLKEQVHKLHGACCYVGVPNLKQITEELEQILPEKNFAKINKLVKFLDEEITSILEALKNNDYSK